MLLVYPESGRRMDYLGVGKGRSHGCTNLVWGGGGGESVPLTPLPTPLFCKVERVFAETGITNTFLLLFSIILSLLYKPRNVPITKFLEVHDGVALIAKNDLNVSIH